MSPTTANIKNKNLQFVEDLNDYKVHHDDTDIRGFSVKLRTGETIGEVEGLLADVRAKEVRYAEIEVDDDIINRHTLGEYSAEDRHLLIPIGLVQIDSDDREVHVQGVLFDHFVNYPRFNRSAGYTTSYELDTNNYLADFHEFGPSYNRSVFDTPRYRQADTFDDSFYASKFYLGR